MGTELFLFSVKHHEHGEVQVIAQDLLHAVVEAAHSWGIMKWTTIARECDVQRLGPAQKKKAAKKTDRRAKEGERHGDQGELSGNRGRH